MGFLFVDLGEVRTFDLADTNTIGRDSSNDIVVRHPTVSRTHARIDKTGDHFFLTDFTSRNGTRVNGRGIDFNVPLQNGARLRIGHVRAWFYSHMPDKLPRSLTQRDSGVVFNCACGQRLWSATDTAGMSVVCNACNQNVEVPASGQDVDEQTATVAGAKLAVAEADAGQICGICQWPIDAHEAAHVCPACKTPTHQECWLENRGCSTYGCSQVNVLGGAATATPPPAAPIETNPPVRVTVWGHVLLGLSVVASLLGLLAFGIPAALLALMSLGRLVVSRGENRLVLTAATAIAVIGAAAGVMISRFWWLDVPLF